MTSRADKSFHWSLCLKENVTGILWWKKVLLELHSFDDLKSIIVENNSIHCHFNFNWYASGIPYHHGNKFTKIRNPCIVGMIQIVPPWSASATLIDKSNKSWFWWRWNACPCHNEASFNHLVIMMMILILMMVMIMMRCWWMVDLTDACVNDLAKCFHFPALSKSQQLNRVAFLINCCGQTSDYDQHHRQKNHHDRHQDNHAKEPAQGKSSWPASCQRHLLAPPLKYDACK